MFRTAIATYLFNTSYVCTYVVTYVLYRIVKNFGGKKVWQIWRITANSPKFLPPIFTMKHMITQFVPRNVCIC